MEKMIKQYIPNLTSVNPSGDAMNATASPAKAAAVRMKLPMFSHRRPMYGMESTAAIAPTIRFCGYERFAVLKIDWRTWGWKIAVP